MVLGVLAGMAFAFLVGGFCVLVGVSFIQNYRRMAATEPTDVRDVEGSTKEVELVGTARSAGETITAPISGEDTLLYELKVKYYTGSGGEGSNWRTAKTAQEGTPFVVADDTGEILVDPEGAQWDVSGDEWEVDGGEEPPPEVREFVESHGYETVGNAMNEVVHKRDRRFYERRIDPGEDVYVFGPVEPGPAEDAPSRAVRPYVASDRAEEAVEVSMDLIPGVGDPEKSLSLDASEKTVFTVTDTGEESAQRSQLTSGIVWFVVGLLFVGAGLFPLLDWLVI